MNESVLDWESTSEEEKAVTVELVANFLVKVVPLLPELIAVIGLRMQIMLLTVELMIREREIERRFRDG